MQRVVSIWLPQFPIERLRRALQSSGTNGRCRSACAGPPNGKSPQALPFALVEGGARGVKIAAVNRTAAVAGIFVGQSLADARAGLPSLRVRPAESRRDATALEDLARWAGRYGPSRNTDGVDGVWVDIGGVAHLFGGEVALLADCHRRLVAAGYTACLAVADTAAAAWALARFGGGNEMGLVAPEGDAKAALAELPVEALRLSRPTVVLLKRLGLHRIGELYGLPRASLARRFRDRGGPARARASDELADGVIWRLDQALGVIREPRQSMRPAPCRLVRHVFAEPLVSPAGIDGAVAESIGELCAMLADNGEGARQLLLAFYRTDGSQAEIGIGTSSPSRDMVHVRRLFAEKLGEVDLGFGVDVLTLEASIVERLDAAQSGLGARSNNQGAQGLTQLIDRLANRVSAAAVHRIAPRPSHIPEQADIYLPALAPPSVAIASPGVAALRPPFLLGKPEAIEVIAEVPEGPPRRFVWRRVRYRIVKAEGPERIEPAWWQDIRSDAPPRSWRPRDYYRVEDDRGGRYWVFREGLYDRKAEDNPPAWYVHGLFG